MKIIEMPIKLQADKCFDVLGGWYEHNFCCYPPHPEDYCDWNVVRARLENAASVHESPESFDGLRKFPLLLREWCCMFPGRELRHPCWFFNNDHY